MDISFQSSDLEALIRDVVDAPAKLRVGVRAVVAKGAVNVKADARQRFTDQRVGNYLPRYAASITYSVADVGLNEFAAEIGPTRGGANSQGFAGPIVEYGTAHTPPMPHLNPALDAEDPKFVAAVEIIAGDVLS